MIRNNTPGLNETNKPMVTKEIETQKTLLTVKNLSVRFDTEEGPATAADQVDFQIMKGENVGLVGESGCGKSVTALAILRLIPSPPGRIEAEKIAFSGQDILSLNAKQMQGIRGSAISMIFQEPSAALSPLHRIGRQMIEAISLHRKMPEKAAWEYAEKWLAKVGISDAAERMYAYPFQLSGGMQQRIMIAMALMLSPKLIIADEPTTALDVTTQAQVFDLIRAMKREETSMLLITHDMGVVWEMCERILVMYAARIVEAGSREDIFSNPKHPYTKGLLNAVPKLTGTREVLKDIPGQVPSPFAYPAGCHFEPRCPDAMARCKLEKPPFYDCGPGHQAACFLMSE
jgi:peptide/nickel transport system ATP-binding protein/oligopeptide transport system ATP-binding protein